MVGSSEPLSVYYQNWKLNEYLLSEKYVKFKGAYLGAWSEMPRASQSHLLVRI